MKGLAVFAAQHNKIYERTRKQKRNIEILVALIVSNGLFTPDELKSILVLRNGYPEEI